MTSFRLKQIGLSLCLMVSLLTATASACMCSHHQEKHKATENYCHGLDHGSIETDGTSNAVNCICFVGQSTPVLVARSENTRLKADKKISNSDLTVPDAKLVAVTPVDALSVEFARDFSYSTALESLLPARLRACKSIITNSSCVATD